MKRVVLAALLFAALLAVTWLTARRREAPAPPVFFALKRRLPDTLTVAFGPDTTVMVPGGETGWQLVHPVVYPADGLLVEGLLKRLTPLEVSAAYDLPASRLDTYGIRFPQARLRAAYRDLSPDTVTIGAYTPDGGFMYVRGNSDPRVGVIPSSVARGNFVRDALEWRDVRFLPFPESEARRLVLLRNGAPRVELIRDDSGWRVVLPYPGPASEKKTWEYLKSINHMHIQAFPPVDPEDRKGVGLDPPRAGVRVELLSGSVVACDLGNPWPGDAEILLAQKGSRPEIVGVSRKYLPVLEREADALREPLAVTFGLKDVDSVRVGWSEGNVTVPRPAERPDRVRQLLDTWLRLEAEAFSETPPGGSPGGPEVRIIWFGGGDTLAVEEVGARAGDRLPLRVPGGRRARSAETLYLPAVQAEDLLRRLEGALTGAVVDGRGSG